MNGNLLDLKLLSLIATGIALTAAISYFLTGYIRRAAHRMSLLDNPNERSSHSTPTPRLGGIAIVTAFVGGLLFYGLASLLFPQLGQVLMGATSAGWILGGALVMVITGLVDDLRGLRPMTKLSLQLLAAGIVAAGGFRFHFFSDSLAQLGFMGEVIGVSVTVLWIVGVINAINLIDGLDGLAVGISVIALSAMAIAMSVLGGSPSFAVIAALIAACAGFLIHNSHPASIFMGDTGSLFLGFMLASTSLVPAQAPIASWVSVVPILALGLPILDTFVAMYRRAREGKAIFSPDHDHIHHRMSSRLGYSHRATVYALYSVSVLFGLAAVIVAVVRDFALLSFCLSTIALFICFLLVKLEYVLPSRQQEAPATRS